MMGKRGQTEELLDENNGSSQQQLAFYIDNMNHSTPQISACGAGEISLMSYRSVFVKEKKCS